MVTLLYNLTHDLSPSELRIVSQINVNNFVKQNCEIDWNQLNPRVGSPEINPNPNLDNADVDADEDESPV